MASAKGKGKAGVKILRLRVPYSLSMSCAIGGGIGAVQPVLLDSNTAEWAAVAALYDEYRVLGGALKFAPCYQAPVATTGLGPDSLFMAIGYDPADGTAYSSVRAVTELSQHSLLAARATGSAANSNLLTYTFNSATATPHVLRWKTGPVKDLSIGGTGLIEASPGQWKSIKAAGSNNPDGWFKMVGISDFAAVATVLSGINYVDVEFRSRR